MITRLVRMEVQALPELDTRHPREVPGTASHFSYWLYGMINRWYTGGDSMADGTAIRVPEHLASLTVSERYMGNYLEPTVDSPDRAVNLLDLYRSEFGVSATTVNMASVRRQAQRRTLMGNKQSAITSGVIR